MSAGTPASLSSSAGNSGVTIPDGRPQPATINKLRQVSAEMIASVNAHSCFAVQLTLGTAAAEIEGNAFSSEASTTK
jgi:hypothetical protein